MYTSTLVNIKYCVYIHKYQQKVGNTFTVAGLELQSPAIVSHTDLRGPDESHRITY